MVEILHATIHGGPFAATAIDRSLRPISHRNLPAALLPDAILEGNSQGLRRFVDGRATQD